MNSLPSKPITLRDIARRAGVSHSTVSRALKNSPRIGASTKEKIQRLAEEMGYAPDPVNCALSNYRTGSISQSTGVIRLALVSGQHLEHHWKGFVKEAKESASRYGYECDYYRWDPKLSSKENSQRLKESGVKGLILGPLWERNELEKPELDWADFATLTVGRFISRPQLDCITENAFQATRMALEKCSELNFERPGLLILSRLNIRTGFRIQSAFNSFWDLHPDRPEIKELIIDRTDQFASIKDWIENEKVDSIISHWFVIRDLVQAQFPFPPEMRLIVLDLLKTQTYNHDCCGVIRNDQETALTAIALLHDKVIRGEIGIPETPKDTLLDSNWKDGETLIRNLSWNPNDS